jgi:hypothetical protein
MATTTPGETTIPSAIPTSRASGPGYLGPNYNPADELLPPASIGVRRGGDLGDVLGAVKGIIYYGDMIGFGQSSSNVTRGMPGLKPLGVNYFVNSGIKCSNGATMYEYVTTMPTGNALGEKVRNALRDVNLPQLRGMAPGILEDAQNALNPTPIINAITGSGNPVCKLVTKPVGDFDGNIYNVDGEILIEQLAEDDLVRINGRAHQTRWIQDREVTPNKRPGETDDEHFARGEPVLLTRDEWDKEEKLYGDNGCLLVPSETEVEPEFCKKWRENASFIQLSGEEDEGFRNYKHPIHRMVSLSLVAISLLTLIAFWATKSRK